MKMNAKSQIENLLGPAAKILRRECEAAFKTAQARHEERAEAILADVSLNRDDRKRALDASKAEAQRDKLTASTVLAGDLGLWASGDVTAALATSVHHAYCKNDFGTVEFCAAWASALAPWIKAKSKGDGAVKNLASGLLTAFKAREVLAKNDRLNGFKFAISETLADLDE